MKRKRMLKIFMQMLTIFTVLFCMSQNGTKALCTELATMSMNVVQENVDKPAPPLIQDPSVSKEAMLASYENAIAPFTPEEYVVKMNQDPTFNLRAYMYYNEDLMSAYTYNYWQYYKHYLEKGMFEMRGHFFPAEDAYNTVTLGRYTTVYDAKIPRAANVELASQFLHGKVVMPGEMFSFNDVVGPRTAERGFKIAHVYVNKQVVDGIGGGICQVSSTLYTAMMIAGIPAIERHVHCLPVTYLKPNLDATICWKSLDLKFVNPYDFPIVIFSESKDGLCTVSIVKYPTDK